MKKQRKGEVMPNPNFSNFTSTLTRRQLLGIPITLTLTRMVKDSRAAERKRIAAVVTSYWYPSHAYCFVGAMTEGYPYYGEHRSPRVQVVSMYTDQVPDNDMSRDVAAKHGITIYPTIRETLMMEGKDLAVDGVLIVGEHGNYPINIKEQQLYPRYYFYKQVIDVFRETGRTVPVFCDKYFSHDWNEAKWIYDQSVAMGFPLMAGSSLPFAWRFPPLELDLETPVEKALFACYGGKERYGCHALEALQCMVERREGGETGIAAVQCLEGSCVWEWTDTNPWAGRLLDHALARCKERSKPGSPRKNVKRPILFILEYRSGLQAVVYILNGHMRDSAFAADLRGSDEPVSTQMYEQWVKPWGHGSGLYFYIEEMMINSRAYCSVERVLLTTGTLAALHDSSYQNGRLLEKGRRLATPHLHIAYRAQKESLFNRGPVPPPE
ncbi:hypothetical protein ACFL5B_02535 [Candidatus Latescibacterota bacterium]